MTTLGERTLEEKYPSTGSVPEGIQGGVLRCLRESPEAGFWVRRLWSVQIESEREVCRPDAEVNVWNLHWTKSRKQEEPGGMNVPELKKEVPGMEGTTSTKPVPILPRPTINVQPSRRK